MAYFYGIRGVPFTWLTSYLARREQYDMVYDHYDVSSINNVVFEFPQDSLLWLSPGGSLLFSSSSHLSLILFAYDTNIFVRH